MHGAHSCGHARAHRASVQRYDRGTALLPYNQTPTMTRRADRLFQIAELLRGRRLTTAQQLADWLHISPRTVYRDVRDLQLSGVPIEGEAGIGYRLSRSASLPPLTFTVDELAALAAGARMLETWGGASFAKGARGALAKITSAMPADKRATLDRLPIFAPSFHIKGESRESRRAASRHRRQAGRELCLLRPQRRALGAARLAVGARLLGCALDHRRVVRIAGDFRNFDVEQIRELQLLEPFPDMEGRRLADYLRRVEVKQR